MPSFLDRQDLEPDGLELSDAEYCEQEVEMPGAPEAVDPTASEIIAQLSLVRKRIGQAREAMKKIPTHQIPSLVEIEVIADLNRAAAFVEEARFCVKNPMEGSDY